MHPHRLPSWDEELMVFSYSANNFSCVSHYCFNNDNVKQHEHTGQCLYASECLLSAYFSVLRFPKLFLLL